MKIGKSLPHPIPYQGSKRSLATRIMEFFPNEPVRLFEPFAGSAAVSIAAVAHGFAKHVVLSDANVPLMNLWKCIVDTPMCLVDSYQRLWKQQLGNERRFYDQVRVEFNKNQSPECLLYLLARCVKASVRYNTKGEFNQSPDNRRRGAKPSTMAKHIYGASELFNGISTIRSGDFRDAIFDAGVADIIYLDPPYQGVCGKRDNRYFEGLPFDEFVVALSEMNRRDLSYIVSYDGRTGDREYGIPLPDFLNLIHIEIDAGVSTQATLLGEKANTVESLYISQALDERLTGARISRKPNKQSQLVLL